MRDTKRWVFRLTVVLLALATASPKRAQGQISIQQSAQGNQASWVGVTTIGGAATAIDASVFTASGTIDICTALNNILAAPGTASNIVIDARGVNPGTPACSKSPWSGTPPAGGWPSATILLPAGTIVTPSTWILPQQTKIIGEGPGVTVIQAGGSLTGALIQMGAAGTICFGIAISDLSLTGNANTLDGIHNSNAEELSYVQRVAISGMNGTGLFLGIDPNGSSSGNSNHSGPYSDISITVTGNNVQNSCVKIMDRIVNNTKIYLAQPRGLHGVTCTATGSTQPTAGIYLDGGNVSLDDVYINGFADGISVGDQLPAPSNLLMNISGGSSVQNLIHIYSRQNSFASCPQVSGNPNNVCDLTILGAAGSANTTIWDEITTTTLTGSYVGMYVLGEQVTGTGGNIGYSRLTSSPSKPTWFVGSKPTQGSTCTDVGSLLSVTSGSGPTLWGCVGGGGGWKAITSN